MTVSIASRYADLSQISMHYLTAGDGPLVVLLHGIPQTSHEWRRVIPLLTGRYSVIAPDLRGLGDTSRPHGGYDKKTIANDVWELVNGTLGHTSFFLVGHDWGGPVAFSLAAHHPEAIRGLAILDVTIPGDGAEMSQGGRRWHHPFFRTPDLPEALMAGRELIYIDWLFDTYGYRPTALDAADRAEYHRTYGKPGGLRAMLAYYRAFFTDAEDNARIIAERGKLKMPVLALGGDKSFGRGPETLQSLQRLAVDVRGGTIPDCGHWVAEEAPDFVAAELLKFFGHCQQTGR